MRGLKSAYCTIMTTEFRSQHPHNKSDTQKMFLGSLGLAGPQTSQENVRPRFRERSCLKRIGREVWRIPDAFWLQCSSMHMLSLCGMYTHLHIHVHRYMWTYVPICIFKERVNGRIGIQLRVMMSKLTCMFEGDISVIGKRRAG